MWMAVQRFGSNFRRGDFDQFPVAHGAEEAVSPAGVARDAMLID
jgi:hypothetical protein